MDAARAGRTPRSVRRVEPLGRRRWRGVEMTDALHCTLELGGFGWVRLRRDGSPEISPCVRVT